MPGPSIFGHRREDIQKVEKKLVSLKWNLRHFGTDVRLFTLVVLWLGGSVSFAVIAGSVEV